MDHVREAAAAMDVFLAKLAEDKTPPHTEADRPAGCRCDPTDWSRYFPIEPLCGQAFESDPSMPTVCANCQHHEECHE